MAFTVSATTFVTGLASGPCTDSVAQYAPAPIGNVPITNVFVLMLENHSFDNVLGNSAITGITTSPAASTNTYNNETYPWIAGAPVTMPYGPGHNFPDVVTQLAGANTYYGPGQVYPPINLSGFVADFANIIDATSHPDLSGVGDVLAGFDTSSQLPVIYELATTFAVCQYWFSSMPGPTWPNRMFVHAASSNGLDHSPKLSELLKWETVDGFSFPHGNIYDAIDAAGLSWRLYNDNTDAYSNDPSIRVNYGEIPQVSALKGITLLDVKSLSHFASDLQSPYEYQYTFIEPNYGDITGNSQGGSSQHPCDGMFGGEGLIKAVYEAIRNSPAWDTSVLMILYDEHGGFFDSVSPGPAPAPNDGSSSKYNDSGFTFEQFGVRVPAVVVSPWISAGTVDTTNSYDHSSVAATLTALFQTPTLTDRDAAASNITGLLTEAAPRTDAPTTLVDPAPPGVLTHVTDDEAALQDAEPMATEGNLGGFLGITLKTRFELSASDDATRQALIDEAAAVRTRGDARRYIASTMTMVEQAKVTAPTVAPGRPIG